MSKTYNIFGICTFWGFNICKYSSLVRYWSTLGLYSLSGKTSYRHISWSLEAARFDVIIIVSLWNLGSVAADVPVKFKSDCKSLNPNLAALRFDEILR